VSRRGRVGVAAVLLSVSACGAPTGGAAERIDPTDVPYGLVTSGRASSTPTPPAPPLSDQPHVYWVDSDDRAVGVPVSVVGTGPTALTLLLGRLTAGPSDGQRRQGLGTALSPGTSVRVRGLERQVADLDVQTTADEPAADRLPLSVGQIVLTATSLPGVDGVRLVRDGRPIAVPLVGGALTTGPVGASDYSQLSRPRQRTTATAASPTS
jgi:Sporulation and spore germination